MRYITLIHGQYISICRDEAGRITLLTNETKSATHN